MSDRVGPTPDEVEPRDLVVRLGVAAWSILGILVLVGVVSWLLVRGRVILAPLLVGVVLVFVLNPVVTRLQRRGVPRVVGAFVGFAALFLVLGLVVASVGPSLGDQAREFAATFPSIWDDSVAQLEALLRGMGIGGLELWTYDRLVAYLEDPATRDLLASLLIDRLGSVTAGFFEFVLVFVLGPVLGFYLLIDLPRTQDRLLSLVPQGRRAEVAFVGRGLNVAVGGFLRGQLVVALIVGVLLSVGYLLVGLPFYLLIGLLGGLLNIVPFLGPWVGGTLGVVVALATGDAVTAFWALVVAVVVQQVDNHFITPSVLRATVRLHPAFTLLVLVLGGAVAGIWGVVIAVPLAASLKVIVGHWWRTRILGESWEEAEAAIVEAPEGEDEAGAGVA